MRIKKEFLNKETLCDKYGFTYDKKYNEYTFAGRWSELFVQHSGSIDLVTDSSNDCFPIPDILIDMIKDGVVCKK